MPFMMQHYVWADMALRPVDMYVTADVAAAQKMVMGLLKRHGWFDVQAVDGGTARPEEAAGAGGYRHTR